VLDILEPRLKSIDCLVIILSLPQMGGVQSSSQAEITSIILDTILLVNNIRCNMYNL